MSFNQEGKWEQLTIVSHRRNGPGRYFESVQSGVSHHKVMNKFVVGKEDGHDYDLIWRRFIWSVFW